MEQIFCMKTYSKTKSLMIVKEWYRRKFNFNTFPKKSQIFKLVKNFEVHDTSEDCRAMSSSFVGLW